MAVPFCGRQPATTLRGSQESSLPEVLNARDFFMRVFLNATVRSEPVVALARTPFSYGRNNFLNMLLVRLGLFLLIC